MTGDRPGDEADRSCIKPMRSDSELRLKIDGRFEARHLPGLDREIAEAVSSGQSVALDLARTTWIDNPVVAWIISTSERAAAAGWQFRLSALSDHVRQTLAFGSVIDKIPSDEADSVVERKGEGRDVAWDEIDPASLRDGDSCG